MNVDSSACAPSATAMQWDKINWNQCERQVQLSWPKVLERTPYGISLLRARESVARSAPPGPWQSL
jgi:hypothetical protein